MSKLEGGLPLLVINLLLFENSPHTVRPLFGHISARYINTAGNNKWCLKCAVTFPEGTWKGVCGHERVLEKVGGPELTCKIKKIYIEFR